MTRGHVSCPQAQGCGQLTQSTLCKCRVCVFIFVMCLCTSVRQVLGRWRQFSTTREPRSCYCRCVCVFCMSVYVGTSAINVGNRRRHSFSRKILLNSTVQFSKFCARHGKIIQIPPLSHCLPFMHKLSCLLFN